MLALTIIREKFDLNQSETMALNERLIEANAELLLEKGKAYLISEDFVRARQSFHAANQHYNTTKLKLANLALATSPRVFLRLFKKVRARELPFIAGM